MARFDDDVFAEKAQATGEGNVRKEKGFLTLNYTCQQRASHTQREDKTTKAHS